MAKREVPEINAGSMADIAFLLLIFFLVTTTMDKDRAFIRKIPKKIESNQPPPPPIEKRNICAIKANNLNQIMFRNEIMSDPDQISDKIIEFYNKNRAKNDVTNNFPMYTRITKEEIQKEIDALDSDISALEDQDNVEPSILDYKYTQLRDWQKRMAAFELYGKSNLPEVAAQAHIRIEVLEKTDYELMAKIHTEVQEAEYELKDAESKDLWGESYGSMQKLADAEPGAHPETEARLELLGYLYNLKKIEVAPR